MISIITVLASCSDANHSSKKQNSTQFKTCSLQLPDVMSKEISNSDAILALEGDIESTNRIFLIMTKDKLSFTPEEKCQRYFWTEVAAINGNIQAAYELGQSGTLDLIYCPRSKFWAKTVLSRPNELRARFVKGADENLIQNSLALVDKQMRATIAKKCLPLN